MANEDKYENVPVICTVDAVTTSGFVLRRTLSTKERLMAALKIWGAFFLVALVCLFIPILHFVLVPLFLILAFVFGTSTWFSTGEVLRGEIACPNCKHVMKIGKESETWPMVRRCEGCSFTLELKRA